MGRPRKKHGGRNNMFSMRMNEQEHANLVAKAQRVGMTMVEFILVAVDNARVLAPEAKPASEYTTRSGEHLELRRDVKAIGNNLNQIAWRMNAENLAGRLRDPMYRTIIDQQQGILECLKMALQKVA